MIRLRDFLKTLSMCPDTKYNVYYNESIYLSDEYLENLAPTDYYELYVTKWYLDDDIIEIEVTSYD